MGFLLLLLLIFFLFLLVSVVFMLCLDAERNVRKTENYYLLFAGFGACASLNTIILSLIYFPLFLGVFFIYIFVGEITPQYCSLFAFWENYVL